MEECCVGRNVSVCRASVTARPPGVAGHKFGTAERSNLRPPSATRQAGFRCGPRQPAACAAGAASGVSDCKKAAMRLPGMPCVAGPGFGPARGAGAWTAAESLRHICLDIELRRDASGAATSIWRSNSNVEKEQVDMRYLAAIVLLFSFGCADGKSPVEPTASPPVAAQLTFSLDGDVRDTASRPLRGASVRVVNGPRAGTTAMTDDAGRFSMPGTFTQSAITVVASKEGYSPETWNFPPPGRRVEGGHWGFSFRLEPLAPSANLAGEYTLTLTANEACTRLPEEARTRTYTATIVPGSRPTTFIGRLSDARIVSVPIWPPYFEIGVAGDFANLSLSFVEQLSDGTYLAIEGGTAASLGPSGIMAPLNAHFVRCRNQPAMAPGEYWWCGADVSGDECASSNNQLTLVGR